jgi:hypothetical protein
MATATRGTAARMEELPVDFVFFIGIKYIALTEAMAIFRVIA